MPVMSVVCVLYVSPWNGISGLSSDLETGTRKLACTKEPDGCSRCKREGITCHYSPQKTMGRPRKRNQQANTVVVQASDTYPTKLSNDGDRLLEIDPNWPQESVTLAIDPAVDLAGTAVLPIDPTFNDDMSFLDFLGPDFVSEQPLQISPLPRDIPLERGLLNINIDFDSPDLLQPAISVTPGKTPPDLIYHTAITPNLSSQGACPNDLNQDPNPTAAVPSALSGLPPLPPALQPSIQPTPCACLSNLYRALSSIHTLPKDVTAAMQVARGACRIAHDAIQCPVCLPPTHEPVKYPMVTFTTMMTLGSLLPCLADAYHQILEMIDAETKRAIVSEKKPQLDFSLSAQGGIWGTPRPSSSSNDPNDAQEGGRPSGSCAQALTRFDKQDMNPEQWRRTQRALLKIDVYGLSRCDGGEGFTQIGLRDLVAQMDEKSLQRHAQVDRMLEAGLAPPIGLAGMAVQHSEMSVPTCRQVIVMARAAVDSIVIG